MGATDRHVPSGLCPEFADLLGNDLPDHGGVPLGAALTGGTPCSYNDHMAKGATVGARELKTRLGTYLRRVREGQRILVTDRGIPVAELRGLGAGEATREGRLRRLAAEGLLCRPTRGGLGRLRAVRSTGASMVLAVIEDREERF